MTGTSEHIQLHHDGPVATITIDRPEVRNAINYDMLRTLERLLTELRREPPRVLIIRAAEPGFCAGIDLTEARDVPADFAYERIRAMHRMLDLLRGLTVPVIAAVDGVCVGLGCEIVISADLRLATRASRFSYPEPKVAVPSPAHQLIWTIGLARAQDLLLTARWMEADEAASVGLATRLVDDPDQAAREAAEQILALAPLAIVKTKENIRLSIDKGASAASAHHILGVSEAATSEDRREALAAFAEKREPRFTGR